MGRVLAILFEAYQVQRSTERKAFLRFDWRIPLVLARSPCLLFFPHFYPNFQDLFEYIYVIIRPVLLILVPLICAFAVSICCWSRLSPIASAFA